MAIISRYYMKYISIFVVLLAILYNYELHPDTSKSTTKIIILRKNATFQYERKYVYQMLTNIDRYAVWYPNVARVEQIQLVSSNTRNHEGNKYRLITNIPLIGEISSTLIVHTDNQPRRFDFSINSWLLETNSIELKENNKKSNVTHIEWTVYSEHRNALFQYLLLPFAKFYKKQIVREALFSFMIRIRDI